MTPQPQRITEPQTDKLWTSDFLKIGVLSLVFSLAFQMFGTVFPLYLKSLGATATLIGVASAGFTVAAFLSRPIAGHFADRKGRKVVLLVGMSINLLASVFVSVVPSLFLIILFRIAQGPGMATASTVNGTIVSDILPSRRMAEGLGYYGVFFTIAGAIGPAIALSVTKNNNFTPVFIINIVLIAVTLLLCFTINYEKKRAKQAAAEAESSAQAVGLASAEDALPAQPSASEITEEPAVEYKGIWKFVEKTALVPALILSLLSIASAASVTFLVPFASDRGFDSIAIFFTVQAIASLFIRLVGGRISTRFGPLAALVPGLALVGISFLLIAPMKSLPMLLIAAVFYGAGYALCYPVLNALAIVGAPPSRRGIANSTYSCSFDVGMGIGAFIWGFTIDHVDYTPTFVAAGILAFLCIILSTVLLKKKRV